MEEPTTSEAAPRSAATACAARLSATTPCRSTLRSGYPVRGYGDRLASGSRNVAHRV
jgi:hypothetical protein